MGMRIGRSKKEWEMRFLAWAGEMEPDPSRKGKALEKIAQHARDKRIEYRPGWAKLLWIQLCYLPAKVWALQALFLVLLPVLEAQLHKMGLPGWEAFPALSVCMALASLVLVQEFARHFSYKTAELEQCCYLGLSQLWLARVCCISGLDVLAVAALGVRSANYYRTGWFALCVYVLTPFFLANALLLAFFSWARGKSRAAQLGILALAVSVFAPLFLYRQIYEAVWLPVWLLLLAAGVLLCIALVCDIRKKMEGDSLCWN